MFKVLKPSKKGLKVFNPATKTHLPESGAEVKMDKYWRKLEKCGDVVEAEKAKKQPEQKK